MRLLLGLGVLLFASSLTAGVTVQDLQWMSGTWTGSVGGPVKLQENWTVPEAGSIQSLVRMTAGDTTTMVELIVIEDIDDGLQLHIQQWDKGYVPRAGGAQRMTMESVGENFVKFKDASGGGLKTLQYSRPGNASTFVIDIVTAMGQPMKIELQGD
ncbi:DUF6265 family protein [Gammaproteobacteria bacterium]|nr:DUF6265 family protein [Gammaproteobacteria bacterium]